MSLPQFLLITKALADQTRVRIFMALNNQELCVCQVIELFGLAPSTISKHLAILHRAGLIDSRKSGRWMYYRLAEENAVPLAQEASGWVKKALTGDSRIAEDARRLEKVLKMDLEEICRRICQRGEPATKVKDHAYEQAEKG